jgi:glucokinase
VHLLNDLEVIAAALPSLAAGNLFTLNKGRVMPDSAMAVIRRTVDGGLF